MRDNIRGIEFCLAHSYFQPLFTIFIYFEFFQANHIQMAQLDLDFIGAAGILLVSPSPFLPPCHRLLEYLLITSWLNPVSIHVAAAL